MTYGGNLKSKIAEIIDLHNSDGWSPNKATEEVLKFIRENIPAKENDEDENLVAKGYNLYRKELLSLLGGER